MLAFQQTEVFRKWRLRLKDERARAIIASRLDRLAFGHAGDAKTVGDGVSELRIDFGPGFRIILLCGGDKSTQAKDIQAAKRLAKQWSDTNEPETDPV
jgi:putative addiction module killer protein